MIGDSHARSTYATLVGLLSGFDYRWDDNENLCEGNWEWLFGKNCRLTLEINHSVYENSELDVFIKLVTVYDQKSFINAMRNMNEIDPDSILIFEQGQHQDYVAEDIQRMIRSLDFVFNKNLKYFMFPPESSYNKAPRL